MKLTIVHLPSHNMHYSLIGAQKPDTDHFGAQKPDTDHLYWGSLHKSTDPDQCGLPESRLCLHGKLKI